MKTTKAKPRKIEKRRSAEAGTPMRRTGLAPIKTADPKGRVNLGQQFANVTFTVKQGADATEIVLIVSRVIPERELWLHQNPQAMESVQRGLQQAREGQFSQPPPDFKADCKRARDED